MDAVTLYSTWPDIKSAEDAAQRPVEQSLIACANILPGAVSVYRWQGEMQRDGETIMFAKTTAARAAAARDALLELHPYDVPCIIALRIDSAGASTDFLTWINAQTS